MSVCPVSEAGVICLASRGRWDSRCAWHFQGRAYSYMTELAIQDSINRLSDCYDCVWMWNKTSTTLSWLCLYACLSVVSFCFSFHLFLFLILSVSVSHFVFLPASVHVTPSLSVTVLLLFWIKEVRITFAQLSRAIWNFSAWVVLIVCFVSSTVGVCLIISLATASGMITDETGLPDWTWIKWQWLILSR